MSKIKERTMGLVVEGASDLFLEKSIGSVTMEEIAKYVGLGAASMYRYFGTKQALAVKVATLLAENIYNDYFCELKGDTSFEKLEAFYMAYLKVFKEKREYYRFVREFDLLYLADAGEGKNEYEDRIDSFYSEFNKLYEGGLADGSVRKIEDPVVFYFSTTHALLNLCKALSKKEPLVALDECAAGEEQVRMLIQIILYRLNNKEN